MHASKQYRATCDKCDHVAKHSHDRGFLDGFFLPERCPECDDRKNHRKFIDGWNISYGHYQRDIKFVLWKPSTWSSGFTWTTIK